MRARSDACCSLAGTPPTGRSSARLMERARCRTLRGWWTAGRCGNLATLIRRSQPMLWTSIATGKRPFKHGIHGFTEPTPDGLGVRPITNARPHDQGRLEHPQPERV